MLFQWLILWRRPSRAGPFSLPGIPASKARGYRYGSPDWELASSATPLPAPADASVFHAARVREALAVHHEADIRDRATLHTALHAAASRYRTAFGRDLSVRTAYAEPQETFDVNITGTINLLESFTAPMDARRASSS